jgi:hypothetical protein
MTPEERFERIEETLAAIDARLDRAAKQGDRTDARLDRAVRLAVQEARAERARRRKANAEFDEKMTQLAAAQLVTDEKLQGLIDSLRRGGNGHT